MRYCYVSIFPLPNVLERAPGMFLFQVITIWNGFYECPALRLKNSIGPEVDAPIFFTTALQFFFSSNISCTFEVNLFVYFNNNIFLYVCIIRFIHFMYIYFKWAQRSPSSK